MAMSNNLPSGYDIASLPWKDPTFLRTVNRLILWAMASMAMLNNQKVIPETKCYILQFLGINSNQELT